MLPIPEFIRPIASIVLGFPGRVIPYAAQKPVLYIVLNRAFREPLQHGELEFLEGSKVRIKVTDMHLDWLIQVGAERFSPVDREQDEDVCISGEFLDLPFSLPARPILTHCFSNAGFGLKVIPNSGWV